MQMRYGFIHEKLDIKILILFIMGRVSAPVDIEELADLTLCDDGISYFDFAECVADLVKTEHLAEENGRYSITDKGRRNGQITETSLPYSVRVKAEKSASDFSRKQKRDSLITAYHTMLPHSGCTVHLAMSDGIDEIISIDLLTADSKQAAAIQEAFKANAEKIYNGIIKLFDNQ